MNDLYILGRIASLKDRYPPSESRTAVAGYQFLLRLVRAAA